MQTIVLHQNNSYLNKPLVVRIVPEMYKVGPFCRAYGVKTPRKKPFSYLRQKMQEICYDFIHEQKGTFNHDLQLQY